MQGTPCTVSIVFITTNVCSGDDDNVYGIILFQTIHLLPVIYFQQGDNQINELHGYVDKMDVTQMRDSITPVDDTRILPVIVHTYGEKIDAMRFEIRSMDGQRLVAKSNVTDYKTSGNKVTADLMIQNILDEDQEYILIVT